MKSAILSAFLTIVAATAAFGHSTGLAHAHPHPESSVSWFQLLMIAIAGVFGAAAFRFAKRKAERARILK